MAERTHVVPSEPAAGESSPLGATVTSGGVNFCVFSKNCTALELLLFEQHDQAEPSRVIPLDPVRNRSFYYWHVFVPGVTHGQLYGYRAAGRFAPQEGLYFDSSKVLLDPYARSVMYGANYDRRAATRPGSNVAQSLKSVVVDTSRYDWEGDVHLKRSMAESIIYEMHLGGFTRHPTSGVPAARRGTFAGVVEKIPYLQRLGVTAVELLPVQQFDDRCPMNGRRDYWGYNPIAFFAPHRGYSSVPGATGPVDDFRDMVKALHRAGIEVILDVVFNHTAEGDDTGPTLSFRGLENRAYYIPHREREGYANYSGCGNTVNGNHSIVRRLIIDALRYWVREMHVDGFRFDLASVLSRDESGQPMLNPPILWEIESDPVLASTKLIAEAWDARGLYQVGRFIGHRWAEWNGQFRDDVRQFVRGEPRHTGRLAARILGSPDVYSASDRDPHRSINYVTCHDGFTLRDLVAYNQKHNEANGEGNLDGSDANASWNCGVEGETSEAGILALRNRQVRNLLSILLLSHGTPMLLMGDELGRTQGGNNNAWCQDNEVSWLEWSESIESRALLVFVQNLIQFRRAHWAFRQTEFWTTLRTQQNAHLRWHGVLPNHPDFRDDSHSLAFTLESPDKSSGLYVILNAYWEPLAFHLPEPCSELPWRRIIDTSCTHPHDFLPLESAPSLAGRDYQCGPRSVVMLVTP